MRTITMYDKEDVEELHCMGKKEIFEELINIKRTYLPQDHIFHAKEDRDYSEEEYRKARAHIAINKAINILEDMLNGC